MTTLVAIETLVGYEHRTHIVVEYDRHNMWFRARRSTAPEPKGMSGGALIRFDSATSGNTTVEQDKLAGVLIDYPAIENEMVATRIGVFVEFIYREFRDLFAATS